MGGDYTRFSFDPVKEFSGLRKQQGRVSLDSDFNEFEAILDRRRRAEMHDTVGSVGRAVVPMTTPDGFKIGLSGTQVSIGVGRAYVDGILAECFGDMGPGNTIDRDDVLGGVRGAGALPYDKQPFHYAGFPGLVTTGGTINTVYLDVWQREVTVFEDEALREPALNGPDTATRVQTAWQVKVMGQPATSSNCEVAPPGWAALIAPSTARLTAKADGVLEPPPGPCEINPSGGYTGLENRLYRVEVHSDGTIGGTPRAQFKWSRDNASIAARVIGLAPDGTRWKLTVSSTGPDGWQRFDTGDHVELIDDDIEFAMREKKVGGRMMKVVSADHANEVLVVEGILTGFTLRPERHPRIRRWDRPAASSTEPLLRDATVGGQQSLEDGIKIAFEGAATDTLRAGDYWVFEARTATGQTGRLVNAPPRGPMHHFAKLAYVTVNQQPTNCRLFWPPVFVGGGIGEGCCTVVVKPGDDIQAAIGSLAGKGGCVCLKMGIHTIPKPLEITQDNITLHAEAPLVTVRLADGGPTMLSVTSARNVSVVGIHFQAANGAPGGAMVSLDGVRGGRIADCAFGFANVASAQSWDTLGIRMEGCHDYAIGDNGLNNFMVGIKGQECDRVTIAGNHLTGPSVLLGDRRWSSGNQGIIFTDTVGIEVERNLLSHYRRGITIGELALSTTAPALALERAEPGCRIVGNVVDRSGTVLDNVGVDNVGSFANASRAAIAFAIEARMPRCEILENAIRLNTYEDGGILADCGNVYIARNLLSSAAVIGAGAKAFMVPRGVVGAVRQRDALACAIRDNLFTGLQQAVFVSGTGNSEGAIRGVDIAGNHVAGSAELFGALAGTRKTAASSPLALLVLLQQFAAIAVAQIRLGRIANNEISMATCAVLCTGSTGLVVQGNTVSSSIAGIVLGNVGNCDVADNQIDRATLGVCAIRAKHSVVQRNSVTETTLAIIDMMGTGTRIQDNEVSGGLAGIELFVTADGDVRGNTVQDPSVQGIGVLPVNAVTLSHNKAIRCGYRKDARTADSASGISVLADDADVLIESCQALDTGGSSVATNPIFTGERIGIAIRMRVGRARVHGCTITSPSIAKRDGGPGGNSESRALLIAAGVPPKHSPKGASAAGSMRAVAVKPSEGAGKGKDGKPLGVDGKASVGFADATNNLAEQTAMPAVEIVTEGEVIFAANRCRLLDPEEVKGPVVSLTGTCLVVTGNRVRSHGGHPSLELIASYALTAVGNITTTDVAIGGAPLVPAAYGAANVRT